MESINKTNKLLANLNTILSKETVDLIYNSNNIKFDRVNLYNDFILSLIKLISDTYLGDDITNEEERLNHFNWCWNKNLNNFKEENIIFYNTKDLHEYFMTFILQVYYLVPDKEKNDINLIKNINKMWLDLFDMHKPKTKSDMDSFIELYELFELTLLNKVK